jgi:beta-phosphoglucomutase-like phosphatase (HAD superfamily)
MLKEPVEAALFDMDGLLIDTEAVYIEALQAAARSLGLEMPLDFCHSMIGIPGRECAILGPRQAASGDAHPGEVGRRRAARLP